MIRFALTLTIISALGLGAGAAFAGDPQVIRATASRSDMGWRFDVTLRHDDAGWDHYADGWEIVDAVGNRLGYRELYHPHVDEQPFTRSLSGVMVPDGVREVYVRARCSVKNWSGELVAIALTR